MAAMTEIQKLHLRWHEKTGEDMPANIASLPIDQIRKAVDWTERGITDAMPKASLTPSQDVDRVDQESSMRNWDKDSEY